MYSIRTAPRTRLKRPGGCSLSWFFAFSLRGIGKIYKLLLRPADKLQRLFLVILQIGYIHVFREQLLLYRNELAVHGNIVKLCLQCGDKIQKIKAFLQFFDYFIVNALHNVHLYALALRKRVQLVRKFTVLAQAEKSLPREILKIERFARGKGIVERHRYHKPVAEKVRTDELFISIILTFQA